MLTLLKQTYSCALGSRLKKRPCMTHKAAKKPARASYPNTLQTQHPGPPGPPLASYHGHTLPGRHTRSSWVALGSYFRSLSLSALLRKMGFTTMPTSQGCCEDPMRQCTGRPEPRASPGQALNNSYFWCYLNCTYSQYCASL